MQSFLSYWLWPNPAGWTYGMTKVQVMLVIIALLVVGSFVLRAWRKRLPSGMTKILTRSWAGASIWFGVIALILVVSRVEQIQFLSMRLLWLLWGLSVALYVLFQFWQFQKRHYAVMQQAGGIVDERDPYLPKKKKK